MFLDPDIDANGRELAQEYAENEGVTQLMLCLPVALFAAWRAGLLPLWTPVAVSIAIVLAQALQPFGSGLLILAVAMVALAYALYRSPIGRESPASA